MNPIDSMEQAKEMERQRRRAYMSSKGQRPGAQASRTRVSSTSNHQPAKAKMDPMEAAKEAERQRRRASMETQPPASPGGAFAGLFAGYNRRRGQERQEDSLRQQPEIQFKQTQIEKDMQHGHELHMGMRAQIEGLTVHYAELKTSLAVHGDRAKARWASDNITGALISLKRVKRVQAQLDQVLEASNYLLTLEMDLLSQMEHVKHAYHSGTEVAFGTSFSQFEDYASLVQSILEEGPSHHPDDSTDDSDDDNERLLLELAEFSTAVGSH